ncbi:hypothetical protein ACLB2K_037814 [Fragaria x ananassa]
MSQCQSSQTSSSSPSIQSTANVEGTASLHTSPLGPRVVDPFRASLTPKMVEALVCTSDWLKCDQPNLYKDPSEDELAIYAELEEIERENGFNQGQEAASTPIELTGGSGQTNV